MTTADHANTVRDALDGLMRGDRHAEAVAALDALQAQAEEGANWKASCARYLAARQAAEAEVIRLRGLADTQEKWAIEPLMAERNRLRDALRPFVENWDFHACDYLAELVDGKEARVIEAGLVEDIIAAQKVARAALAGEDT